MTAAMLESAAFCLILILAACADSLGETPGGMAALVGGVALSGLMIYIAQTRDLPQERAARRPHKPRKSKDPIPLRMEHKRPSEGKRKAVAVVATPQRQVKQTRKSILRPYFTGAKGECQIELFELQNDRRSAPGR